MLRRLSFTISSVLYLSFSSFPLLAQWQPTNGPWCGRCLSLFATPPTIRNSNGVILAGLYDYGIYRSIDLGQTWVKSTTDLGQSFTSAFACQHQSTLGSSLLMYAMVGNKIFSSGDEGATWQACAPLPENPTVQAMTTTKDSTGAEILLVGTRTGLLRSTDNGASWKSANNGLTNLWILTFSNYIPPDPGKNAILFVATGDGVYLSRNGGASWIARNSGNGHRGFNYLVVDPSSTDLNSLRLRAADFSGGSIIYRSDDSGKTWRWENININWSTLYALIPVTKADGTFSMYSADDKHVYRSDDRGTNWVATDTTAWYGPINALCADASAKATHRLFAGHRYQGVYLSDNGGSTWTNSVQGLTKPRIYNISHTGSTLYAGTLGYGLLRSRDQGDHWQSINNGFDYVDVQFQTNVITGSDTLMAIFSNGAVYRSLDEGALWKKILAGVSPALGAEKYTSLTAGANGKTVYHFLASGYSGKLYRSTSRFDGWQLVRQGFGANSQLTDILGFDGKLFVATYNSDIFSSDDLGATWTLRDSAISRYDPYDLEVMNIDGKNALIVAMSYGGFFLSKDYGVSWTVSKNGLANASLNCLATANPIILAGSSETQYGYRLYGSVDLGQHWSRADEGAEAIKPALLHIAPMDARDNKMVYMGTEKEGIWRRPLAQFSTRVEATELKKRPADFGLLQNHPNPFNSETVIRYWLAEAGAIRLAVYDVLGREIATLVEGRQAAGEHRIVFSPRLANLASGVYYAELSYDAQKKMIKLVAMQ